MKVLTVFGEEETISKYCSQCQTNVPISSFRSRKEGRGDGGRIYTYCIPCEKVINKEISENRKKAGTKAESCECCGKNTNKLVVDHDHKTGKNRGWICQSCNVGIGRLGDNLRGLLYAVDYLKKSENG